MVKNIYFTMDTVLKYKKVVNLTRNTNISLNLLRATNFPLIFCFLGDIFKEKNLIDKETLINYLGEYFDEIDYDKYSEDEEITFQIDKVKSERYINYWIDKSFLCQRTYKGEKCCELTPQTEEVFDWFNDINDKKESSGTGFKIKLIFEELKSLVNKSETNYKDYILTLEKQKDDIIKEIRQIERDPSSLKILDSTELTDGFQYINGLAKRLITDFKTVDQNFVDFRDDIISKETENSYSKGDILGLTLNNISSLDDGPEGKSFNDFQNFIRNPKRKKEFNEILTKLFQILNEKGIDNQDSFLENFESPLYEASIRVGEKKKQLNSRLYLIINASNLKERKEFLDLVRNIKIFAIKNKTLSKNFNFGISMDYKPEFNFNINKDIVLEKYELKPLGEPPKPAVIDETDNKYSKSSIKSTMISSIKLKNNVKELLKKSNTVSLKEVLAQNTLKYGLSEIISYFTLVEDQKFQKSIVEDEFDEIIIDKDKRVKFKVQKLIFKNGK